MKSLKNLIYFCYLMIEVIAEEELSKCPDLKPMADLDMQKIVKDTWNAQFLYARPNNKTITCMSFDFNLRHHNKDIDISEDRQYGETEFYSESATVPMKTPGEVLIKGISYSHVIIPYFLVLFNATFPL